VPANNARLVALDSLALGSLQLALGLLTVTEVRVVRLHRLNTTSHISRHHMHPGNIGGLSQWLKLAGTPFREPEI